LDHLSKVDSTLVQYPVETSVYLAFKYKADYN
jgi:hypothetical protein